MSYGIEDMLEISFKENDDFLKIRETLTRIGVASRKEQTYINHVTYYTNEASIIWFILRNYSR